MSHIVAFTVSQKSKNLYQLPIASTMLHFAAYDFTYFVQQCTELTTNCMATGLVDAVSLTAPKEYIRKCHPYFQILVLEDFEQITLDFAIDYICRTQGIGLEELWATHISAKQPFWKAVFHRISAYKSGSAINQWDNLLRMQQYALSKLAFIFDGTPVTAVEYRMRKEYYDLAFSILSEKMGYQDADLPHIKYYTPALCPGAPTVLGRLSNELAAIVSPMAAPTRSKRTAKPTVTALQDQSAGLVLNHLSQLSRPGPMEARTAMEACDPMPDRIYIPTSFKAILDLEFNEIIENAIRIVRSPETNLFVLASTEHLESMTDEVPEFSPAPAPVTLDTPEEVPLESPDPVEEEEEIPSPTLLDSAEQEMPAWQPDPPTPSPPAIESAPLPEEPAPFQEEATPFQNELPPSAAPVEPMFIASAFEETAADAPANSADNAPPKDAPVAVQNLFSSSFDRLHQIAELTNDMSFQSSPHHIGEDLNVRCQLIQTALRSNIGRQENAKEFDEWSRSLMKLRISVVRKQCSIDYLERFLDSTEQVYQLQLASA